MIDLDSPQASSVWLAGGKAAGLHALRAAGLPCPYGIVVTTAAHRLAGARPGDPVAGLPAGLSTRLTGLLAGRLAAEAAALGGDGTFAVRSSAPGEDGRRYSFAGQHATLLGVPAGEVGRAVAECWASLWSERATGYRAGTTTGERASGSGERASTVRELAAGGAFRDEAGTGAAMAVVVQPLLPALAAAVVFTRDPIGEPDMLRVELTAGLGDRLVAGEVDPDSYQLDRISLRVTGSDVDNVDWGRAPVPIGTAQVRQLAELCLRAERGLGTGPLDIESAYLAGHGWLLLQARPITTLGDDPISDDRLSEDPLGPDTPGTGADRSS